MFEVWGKCTLYICTARMEIVMVYIYLSVMAGRNSMAGPGPSYFRHGD